MERIPTGRPSWDKEMRIAAMAVLDSKRWVKGAQGRAFGEAFAAHCGALSATPCQNGSSALWAALRIANVGPGDEVITPSYTFISTATCILLVGATPVFVDVEPDYFCLDVNAVQNAITPATKAVIGVHLFGQPYDPRLLALCDTHNLALVEDAAQAHGATQQLPDGSKRTAGSMGDIGCFSFFPSKNMAVGGEGGMLTTTLPAYTAKISGITNHGRSPDLEAMELGSNLRMSEVSAAIGLEQLKQLDRWVERRRTIAARYTEAIEENTFLQPPKVRPGAEHAWHQFCVHTTAPEALVAHFDRLGIDARRYYTVPIHQQSVFAHHSQHGTDLAVTNTLGATLVAIPVMHELTEKEILRIIQALKEFKLA
jgi:perosamine synthetase